MNAIIFDFDGTIADSFDEVLAFLQKHSSEQPTDDTQTLKNLSMKDLALRVGIPPWRLPLVFFRGKRAMTRRMHTVKAFDGVADMLKDLHHEGYRMYIISSNSRRNIQKFLVENGLSGYFIRIYGNAGWFEKGAVLRRALKQNGLDAAKTIYVGDEARDITGAHIAGMPVIAVNWGFSSEEQLLTHSPTILVRTPVELEKALIDWGRPDA